MLDSNAFIMNLLEEKLPPLIKNARLEKDTLGLLTPGALRKALHDHPEHKLPRHKFGKYVVFYKADFLDWLRKVYFGGTNEQGAGIGSEVCGAAELAGGTGQTG